MRLSAVILARTLAYVETFDLSPRGRVFYPELAQALVDRYKFQKFPKTLEEFDEAKGVEFHQGKIGNKVIQKFTVFNTLLAVETRSSTDDSKQIIEELLLWAAAKFDLNYKPGMIKRFAYVSDLSFFSDVALLEVSPVLTKVAAKCSEALSEIWQEPVHYEPINLVVGHDPLARKYGIAPFSITRRAEAKFSENKYFSEAPLPTDVHMAMLEEYETDVKRMHDAMKK